MKKKGKGWVKSLVRSKLSGVIAVVAAVLAVRQKKKRVCYWTFNRRSRKHGYQRRETAVEPGVRLVEVKQVKHAIASTSLRLQTTSGRKLMHLQSKNCGRKEKACV